MARHRSGRSSHGKQRGPHRSATRRSGPPRGSRQRDVEGVDGQPLTQEFRAALRDDSPFTFVALMSSVLAAFDAQIDLPPGTPEIDLGQLVESFIGIDVAETTAAMHALAALVPDEVLSARLRRALAQRRQPVSSLVRELGQARVTEAVLMSHELGDGDNLILGVRWPDGYEVTPVAYVDHNLGTIVKDAFVIDEPLADVVQTYRDLIAEEAAPTVLETFDLADARATLLQAIEAGRDYVQDGADAQWPAARPLFEMLLRGMPEGGTAGGSRSRHRVVEYDEALTGFLASPEAAAVAGHPEAVVGDAAGLLLQLADEHSGSPLLWSPVTVELVLTHYLPFSADAPDETLDAVATVLPAVVSYGHRVLGMSADSTRDTLGRVHAWLPDFEELRQDPVLSRLRSVAPHLEAALAGDPGAFLRWQLAEQLGGQPAVDALDAAPLPDEPLDLAPVPEDVRPRVAEVAALVDGFVDEVAAEGALDFCARADGPVMELGGDPAHGRRLGVELRTACRRFLVSVASAGPDTFRGRARTDTAAAAVAWAVGRANELVGPVPAAIRSGQLQVRFGTAASPATRARTMLAAIGADAPAWSGQVVLGTPDLLTSTYRGELLRQRDLPLDGGGLLREDDEQRPAED